MGSVPHGGETSSSSVNAAVLVSDEGSIVGGGLLLENLRGENVSTQFVQA